VGAGNKAGDSGESLIRGSCLQGIQVVACAAVTLMHVLQTCHLIFDTLLLLVTCALACVFDSLVLSRSRFRLHTANAAISHGESALTFVLHV
jgi:hypothetical protein